MRTALILALLSLFSAAAQAPSATGTWNVRGEAASGTTEGGGNWDRNAVSGTLVIAQDGETLTGSWTASNRTPVALNGNIAGEKFEFRTVLREVEVRINDVPTTIRLRWTFRGSVAGATLKGTMSLDREGEDMATPQPFVASSGK